MGRPRRNWTPEEDALLRQAVNHALKHSRPLLWREFAKSVPGRSNKDCRRRWWNSLADGTAKGSWSEEEDERLIEAVRKHGTNWSQVARDVVSRNSDQCSSHWSHVLDPDINFCDWTPKEDEHLLHAVLTHGTNWTTIAASHAPNRTTLALKNRYSTLRLRHENNNKPKEDGGGKTLRASSPRSEGALAASNKEMRSNQRVQVHLSRKADEVDEEVEEVEEEGGEDDEDEDGDEEHRDKDDDGKFSTAQFVANPDKTNTGAIDIHTKDSNTTTLSAWASSAEQSGLFTPSSSCQGTSPLSAENWTDNTVDHPPYQSALSLNHPSLYAGPAQDFFGAVQDPNGTSTSVSYTTYGADAMDIVPNPSHGFPTLNKLDPALSAGCTQVGTEASPTQASKNVSMSPIGQCNPATTYHVSIHMVCTSVQLEAVLVNLASAGTCVTMKIDPKS